MKKTFNPGRFRHRVQILKRKPTRNAYGESSDEWEVFCTLQASKDPLLGKEFYEAQTTEARVEVKFNSRYVPGITADMRLRHGTEVYEIIGQPVDVNSMHQEIVFYCRMVR